MFMALTRLQNAHGCNSEIDLDRGEGPTILGDGSEAFDFVSVEDCALANICAMKAEVTDEFYNVGTGTRTTLKELAEMLLELTECTQPVSYKERSEATLVKNRIGCPEKAKREINFTAKENLKGGLTKLIEWRNNDRSPSPTKAAENSVQHCREQTLMEVRLTESYKTSVKF